MDIVADTNIFLAVCLNEEAKDRVTRLSRDASIIAPAILPYEIGNALSAMIKRSKITTEEALKVENATSLIPVRLVDIDIHASLIIAAERDIYAYDAYFLQCARSHGFPLLTLDKRMKQAADKLGIQLLE